MTIKGNLTVICDIDSAHMCSSDIEARYSYVIAWIIYGISDFLDNSIGVIHLQKQVIDDYIDHNLSIAMEESLHPQAKTFILDHFRAYLEDDYG